MRSSHHTPRRVTPGAVFFSLSWCYYNKVYFFCGGGDSENRINSINRDYGGVAFLVMGWGGWLGLRQCRSTGDLLVWWRCGVVFCFLGVFFGRFYGWKGEKITFFEKKVENILPVQKLCLILHPLLRVNHGVAMKIVNASLAQLIEHQPSKLRAAGLSPVFRSQNKTNIAYVAQG